MKTLTFVIGALALAACGSSEEKPVDAKPSPPDAFVMPAPPKLGAQIDRMGRPAVNTALNHTFDANDTTKQAAKDTYNHADDPSMWATLPLSTASDTVTAEFAGNLGIIDSLDSSAQASGCSSERSDPSLQQPLFGAAGSNGALVYAALAGALADDELYLYTGTATCTAYLGVEGATILGLTTPNDCGGRAPSYDVIDVSYTALAIGLGPIIAKSGIIGDGVSLDGDAHPETDTTFPFLGEPNASN
jgi:hypothetical protein